MVRGRGIRPRFIRGQSCFYIVEVRLKKWPKHLRKCQHFLCDMVNIVSFSFCSLSLKFAIFWIIATCLLFSILGPAVKQREPPGSSEKHPKRTGEYSDKTAKFLYESILRSRFRPIFVYKKQMRSGFIVRMLVYGSRWSENVKQTVTFTFVQNLSHNSGWQQQKRSFATDGQILQNRQCRRAGYALGHIKTIWSKGTHE